MLTLHHLENSQSIRILWLLEELGADYHIQHYRRDGETSLAPESFKQLHIIGTSPLISDGELVLPESNAIIDYIMDKYGDGGLRPMPGEPVRARYLYWFHAAQGSLMPLLTSKLVFNRLTTRVPFFLKPIMTAVIGKANKVFLQPRIDKFLRHIDSELAQSPWFAGEQFTAADIVMGYCMDVAAVRVSMDERYPHAQAFLQRMRQRPAFRRAMAKNGDFTPLAG